MTGPVKSRDDKPLPDNIERENKPRQPKVDKVKALAMVRGGMTQTAVAEEFGVTIHAINKLIKRTNDNKPALQDYKDNKAEVFENIQAELLQAVDGEKLKAASAQQLITSAAILQDKIQVLRGQPTSITDVNLRALIAMIPGQSDTETDTERAHEV